MKSVAICCWSSGLIYMFFVLEVCKHFLRNYYQREAADRMSSQLVTTGATIEG